MNQRGQALIEVMFLSSLTIISVFLLIRLGVLAHINLALNETIEVTHICELQKKSDCQTELIRRIQNLGLQKKSLFVSTSTDRSLIRLIAISALGKVFEKESELTLELSTP